MRHPLAAAVMAFALTAAAHADDGWQTAGDALASGDGLTLTTAWAEAGDPDAPFNRSGVSAVGIGTVEFAAGVAAYALDLDEEQVATEGSVAWRSFGVLAGDTLQFDWRFTTLETEFDDHAFVVLDGVVTALATRSEPGGADGQTFSHTFAAAGLATLAVGVVDTVDVLGVSTLELGAFQITPIPEPASALLLAGGLALLVARRRRP